MSWKFLIFLFGSLLLLGCLLLMKPTAIEIITTNYKELKFLEDRTQSNVSLAEFSEKMVKLFSMLLTRLPTGKNDDIRVINNIDDPLFKDVLEEIKADYKDVTEIVPESVKGDTYDFITDMRNFSINLDKAKKLVEDATEESPEYREFQEHHKAELIKLMRKFNNQMIDVAEKYWNSLSTEKRTDEQKKFHEKIQEIKTETEVDIAYDQLYSLWMFTALHA